MIIFLTGAGISAESGIPTYRYSKDSIWYKYDQNAVGHISNFYANYNLVHEFYNTARMFLKDKVPNTAHKVIAELQQQYGSDQIKVITTNVDTLHEQAGCTEVIHLHGRIDEIIVDFGKETQRIEYIGYNEVDLSKYPSDCIIKPNTVMFGEMAPNYVHLHDLLTLDADDLIVTIGCSFDVLPYDGIVAASGAMNCDINIAISAFSTFKNKIKLPATEGIKVLTESDFFKIAIDKCNRARVA